MKTTTSALFLQFLLTTTAPFFATASTPYRWPAGIDPSKKYWPPGQGPPSKRWLSELAEAFNSNQSFTPESVSRGFAVKKIMDPAEKFMAEYWNWNGNEEEGEGKGQRVIAVNLTFSSPVKRSVFDSYAYGGLFKRQNFQCAIGTHACANIGRPQSCCNNDEQCFKIQDTGFGDVGCCVNGRTCSGDLKGCGDDKKTCSSREGGGCCTEGYNCSAQGCVPAEGQVVSSASAPTTTSRTGSASSCSSGYYACPTNLAGGCCPSGRLCGVSDCPSQTTTGTPVASGDACPTGYYTCSAQFNGGCCRIGRDCGITDCPERAITISSGTSQGAPAVTTGGNCASGWLSCPRNLGGGCCPTGYTCAVNNCPAITLTGSNLIISGAVGSAFSLYLHMRY
ncbi:hypothetical protein C7212DRAFT_274982 [Tuber magnatum]|uniref:Carbohydrate-Binding Module Family 18 protein n=1 Tax=Tuber magnatum TaxID=42249 RepID=A0A317SZG6_9PEZI|nr:hypothetical protein C7212DRAFT_274982 [Tuber magnatum]